MASVWKRLQRVNKRAAKFQYTASYHRVDLDTSPKWKPNKLSVVWTRRSRRVITDPQEWEPSLKDPLKGSVIYTLPENHSVAVTLFKDSRTNELEDKDWTFVLEDVSTTGKRRRLAVCSINMRKYASLEPSQRALSLKLEPVTSKITAAALHLTLHCVLLREGQATDEDMQSLASLLSVNNNSDIAVLEDLDEDDYTLSDNSTKQMFDLRQQVEEMTQSLTNSDIAATPNSVQSLNFDNSRTPTAPMTPETNTPNTPVASELTPTMETDLKIHETPKKPELFNNFTKVPVKMESKFSSTPKYVAENRMDNLKGVVFKPKTIAKRNLKPLELKTNLNISLDNNDNENKEEDSDKTPTAEVVKLFPGKLDKDKTPVQDLLEWCQAATREQRSCRVSDLTVSFRSGLALCAIIHRYRPDLIDFSGLQPDDAEHNVRTALEASAKLGISQVLTVADVCGRPLPDRLAVMTYLFQLRAHFTGSELHVEQLGNDETESSYLVGRHDTDGSLPPELFSREISMRRSKVMADKPRPRSQDSQEPRQSQERCTPEKPASPALKEVRDMLAHSRSLLSKALSPARDPRDPRDARPAPTATWFTDPLKPPPARPEKLMTRKELTDPFGSDDEEESPPDAQRPKTVNGDAVKLDQMPTIQPATMDPLTAFSNSQQHEQQTDNKQQHVGTDRPLQKPTTPELPKPTPQLLSRHDELKERARQLLEATKREVREKEKIRRQNSKEKEEDSKIDNINGLRNGETSPKKPLTEEERQVMLRERARKLIADARAGLVSPTSPTSPSRARSGTVEIISKQSVLDELAAAGGMVQLDSMLSRADSVPSSPGSRKSSVSPDRSGDENPNEDTRSVKSGSVNGGEETRTERRSPLQSFSALVDRLTPDKDIGEEGKETGSYIQSELEALEKEQKAIDERAAALEKQLRRVMESADNTEEEDRLMSQWFNLVNKKNALLRRQMQLNILEQEEDLSRRCELLARELRLSLGVDDWRKTPGQKRRERLLLQELLSAVNERDRLVQEMDEQERAIADDDEIERNLSQVEIQRKNNCILQ